MATERLTNANRRNARHPFLDAGPTARPRPPKNTACRSGHPRGWKCRGSRFCGSKPIRRNLRRISHSRSISGRSQLPRAPSPSPSNPRDKTKPISSPQPPSPHERALIMLCHISRALGGFHPRAAALESPRLGKTGLTPVARSVQALTQGQPLPAHNFGSRRPIIGLNIASTPRGGRTVRANEGTLQEKTELQ